MVQVTAPTFPPSLADLSRNASVISSSSDTDLDTPPSELLKTPRPRPVRTFSSPRSRSPQLPQTVVPSRPSSRPPSYLTRELGVTTHAPPEPAQAQQQRKERSKSRKGSREASRARSANGRFGGAQDFSFGDTLGEGSYSTVCTSLVSHPAYSSGIRSCVHVTSEQARNMLSRSSTRTISSERKRCSLPSLRKTSSSNWVRVTPELYIYTGPSRTNGAYVSAIFLVGAHY